MDPERTDDAVTTSDQEVELHMSTTPRQPRNGIMTYRVAELEKDMDNLQKKVDRLTWALVTLTLSIAGSAVIFAVTVLSLRGRS